MQKRNVILACVILITCLRFTLHAETVFGTVHTFDTNGFRLWGTPGTVLGSMSVADVNGDGKSDILVAGQCESPSCSSAGFVAELLGNGDGSFANAQSVGPAASMIEVADMNNDSKPDLIAIVGNDVSVSLGNGDGSFQPSQIFPSNGFSLAGLAISDLNRDGNSDVLISYRCPHAWCVFRHYAGVYLGNGDGTLRSIKPHLLFSRSAGAIAGKDVNHDGKPDMVVLSRSSDNAFPSDGTVGLLTILLGNGDGTFRAPHAFFVPYAAYSLDFSDVNGDGNVDVLITSSLGAGVSLGNGDGTFQPVRNYLSGATPPIGITAEDVTADGKVDLIVSNWCSTVQVSGICTHGMIGVLSGNGDGTFNPVQTYYSGGDFTTVVKVADVTGDQRPDILVLNGCKDFSAGLVQGTVAFRKGLARFQTTTTVQSNLNPSAFNQASLC